MKKNRLSLLKKKKLLNILKVELAYLRKDPVVKAYPYVITIDTNNFCNLKCPLCPTGQGMEGRPKGQMRFEEYKKILDQVSDYALMVGLFNWGEPFLTKDLFKMIKYTSDQGIITSISSNLNVFTEETAHEVVRSGLDCIEISLDATSQEVYEKYRVGGDHQKVLDNIRMIKRVKDELKSKRPRLVIQALVFKHNEHDVEGIKRLAAELDVGLKIFNAGLGGKGQTPFVKRDYELMEKYLTPDERYSRGYYYYTDKHYLSEKSCFWLWRSLTVNWDGGVSPCCCVFDGSTDFGNMLEEPLSDIWNNSQYRTARSLFGKKAASQGEPTTDSGASTACSACNVYNKGPRGT